MRLQKIALLIGACALTTLCYGMTPPNNIEVALVLGGGGARAVAQAGVIDVLEEHHIPIHLIVGSSAGGIIGALYADDPHSHSLRRKVIFLRKWDLLDLNWVAGIKMLWSNNGPVQGEALKSFLSQNLTSRRFSETKIPLVVVTTDVNKGEVYAIAEGTLIDALHASSAIPMIFAPVPLHGRLLADGGIASPVPVEIAKKYRPKLIIAVDIGAAPNTSEVNTGPHLGYRSLHISYYQLSKWQLGMADIVIHPKIDNYGTFTDSRNEEMYRAGREAALAALGEIKARLNA